MSSRAQRILVPSARLLLSLVFLLSGFGKWASWHDMVRHLTAQRIPAPSVFLGLAIAAEVVGGFSVLVGYRARWGAVLLILFLIPASVLLHPFWAVRGLEQADQLMHFLKNLAIMGGLLLI